MSIKMISDGIIEKVTLYNSMIWFMRWDVVPFFTAYAILFAIAAFDPLKTKIFALITLPLVLAVHLTLFLLSQCE